MKQQAKDTPTALSQDVARTVTSGLSDEQLQKTPRIQSLQRTVTRVRKPILAELVDGDVDASHWTEEFRNTKDGQPFLLFDSRQQEPELPRILIFASDQGILMLHQNRNWNVDGTFYTAPVGFSQVYSAT